MNKIEYGAMVELYLQGEIKYWEKPGFSVFSTINLTQGGLVSKPGLCGKRKNKCIFFQYN
jgi:hypothetical protein